MADGMRARVCAETLVAAGHRVIAVVQSGANPYDIAFVSPTGDAGVARCTDEPGPTDIEALHTMLKEGPFTIALLVSPIAFAATSPPIICCAPDQLRAAAEASRA